MGSNEIGFSIVVVTLLILLLIAVVIITLFVANRRNVSQEMKMAQMQLDYEKELRSAAQEVQEQVLVNVGRELHDNIGQLLTLMNMQLEQQKVINPNAGTALRSVTDTLVTTIGEVRRISKSLNSDLLEVNGLSSTIEQEVTRLQQIGKYTVHFERSAEPHLNKDQKIIVFRIFQEILNNIMKHSRAKNIYIALSGAGGFSLSVSDDGKGFDVDEMMRSPKGSGLKNMVKRAELAKMRCNIESAPDKGATFTLGLV
jgi:two-component system NarL family sensor kinase